jgi:hypothetical protein
MAPKEPKLSKQAAAGTTTDIILTIPETLEIIWRAGSATTQSHYGIIEDWIVDNLQYKHKEKITCKNLSQYRYCLIYGILNTLATLQSCGRQIK